jgi:hypothetical protein
MSQLAFDLDLEVPWAPVWEPEVADFDMTFAGAGGRIVTHTDGSEVTKAEWKAFINAGRCRDCGIKCPIASGGTQDGHCYRLCEDCALLDGCRLDTHTTTIERGPAPSHFPEREAAAHCNDCGWWLFLEHWADEGRWIAYTPEEVIEACAEHEKPHHRGRWGRSHEISEHDGLVQRQAKRRAKYLAQKKAD